MNISFVISLPRDGSHSDSLDAVAVPHFPQPVVPPFLEAGYARTHAMCASSFCSDTAHLWRGPHAALVLGPVGSGKSTLLDLLATGLQRLRASSNGSSNAMHVVRVSGNNIGSDMPNNFAVRGTSGGAIAAVSQLLAAVAHVATPLCRTSREALDSLNSWERQVSNYSTSESVSVSEFPSLLLAVEDIDDILRSDSSHGDDGASHSDALTYFQNSLTQLLCILTRPDFSYPVCVVVSTSLTESEVSTRFMGPPGFEVVVSIPPPSACDRRDIIASILQTVTSKHSSQRVDAYDLGDIPASFVSGSDWAVTVIPEGITGSQYLLQVWSRRCADMTAGFLPGDLQSLLRRAVTIREGKIASSPLECSLRVIEWADFLSALATTTPRQLMNLHSGDAEAGATSGIIVEGRNSLMQWSHFAGYESAKITVRSIIDRISSSRENQGSLCNAGKYFYV
jgi:energy-coupling factor transporter ATP-binding protein EcfA2